MCQYKDKDWLSRKYIEEHYSLHEIGKLCGVGAKTIQYWMSKFDLPTRSRKESVIQHFSENKKEYSNTCEFCLKAFQVALLSQTRADSKAFIKYCSDDCRSNARGAVKKKHISECPCCGKSFDCSIKSMTNPNSSKYKKYCSKKCVLSSRNQTGTWIEKEIEHFLQRNDVPYVTQFEIGRYTVDFLIPDKKLVIEANGDFWHANPIIYGITKPLNKIHPRVITKDRNKMARLQSEGFNVLIVWENDLITNKDETLRAMINEIKSA